MLTCFDVADYFMSCCEDESGDLISNLKLQKLVYYAQGFSLALLDRPLFGEPIEAWMHGPVVPALYRKYREYGNQALPVPVDVDFERFTDDERNLLDEVYNVYGQFSAWKLRNMTHDDGPWKQTYVDGAPSEVIQPEAMKRFFDTLVTG